MEKNPEIIGFHKGAVSTLLKERQEFARMIQVVDQLLAAHLKALKELGVEFENTHGTPKKDELDEKLEDLLK